MGKPRDANRVALDGAWDLARKDELTALFDGLKMDGDATIDLRGVTYADSTVLAALAGLAQRFKGITITLFRPPPQILRLLKLVEFEKLFKIVDDD
ncbi:MAG TPA: STAS domain-containing protein [Candidatus Cybelea sp.]